MSSRPQDIPSPWFYAVGAAIAVVGIAASISFARARFHNTVGAMDRYVMPGDHVVDLEIDGYMIFWEKKTIIDGKPWAEAEPPSGISCTVVPLVAIDENGAVDRFAVIEPQRVEATQPYALDDYIGQSVLQFDAITNGEHRLSCGYESGDGPTVAMALDDTGKSGWTVFYVVGGASAALLAGVAFVFGVYIRRARALGRAGLSGEGIA